MMTVSRILWMLSGLVWVGVGAHFALGRETPLEPWVVSSMIGVILIGMATR